MMQEVEHAGGGLPSGDVTFVFTDIEGSTRLLHRLGDTYATLLERHRSLLRACWVAHGGFEVGTEGDSFFVAFGDAGQAVLACAEGQAALEQEPWPPEARVRVRMGVHSGLAYPRADGYVAMAVHQAARVCAAGNGGQVLVTADTVGRVAADVVVPLHDAGRYRLRDFDDAVRLFQVDVPWRAELPPVRALPADGHNLVRPLDLLIGRTADLAVVTDMVERHRLVTIAGPGGVGKSRLAWSSGSRRRPVGPTACGPWICRCWPNQSSWPWPSRTRWARRTSGPETR